MRALRRLSGNYGEYLRYFILLSLALIVLLGGVQYYYSSRSLEETAVENAVNTLDLLKNAHETVLTHVEKSMETVFSSALFTEYMTYYENGKYYTLNSIYDQLRNIVTSNEALKSVCIYYRKQGYTLSSDLGPAAISYYHDNDFILGLDASDFRYRMTVNRQVTYTFQDHPQSVLTLVRTLPVYYATRYPDAYVLIDIDPSYIDRALTAVKARDHASIWILDTDRRVLFASAGAGSELPASLGLPLAEGARSQILNVNGLETLVASTVSQQNGWIYLYAVPMREITGGARQLSYVFGMILAGALFLSMTGSLLFSYRIFKPIRMMSERIAPPDSEPAHCKETERIARHIDRMLAQNRTLEQAQQRLHRSERKRLFLQALHGQLEAPLSPLDAQSLGLHTACPHVVWIARLAASELPEVPDAPAWLVLSGPNELTAVMDAPEDTAALEARIRALLPAAWASQFPSVGISAPFDRPEDLPLAYRQAREALDMRLLRGEGQVTHFTRLNLRLPAPYPTALEGKIVSAVQRGQRRDMEAAVDAFAAQVTAECGDPTALRNAYLQLYCAAFKWIWALGIYSGVGEEFNHEAFLALETVERMNEHLLLLFEQALDAVRASANDKHLLMVDEVCAFIDAHIGQDLSYERLAERFDISPSHLRTIFKDVRGITIKAYVDQKRLELAKEALARSCVRVQDLAERLGFLSPQAFAKFFKGMTGIAPGEYRDRARQSAREGGSTHANLSHSCQGPSGL